MKKSRKKVINKNYNKFFATIICVIVIIVAITYFLKSKKEIENQEKVSETISNNIVSEDTNAQVDDNNEKEEKEVKSKKIDYLAKVTEPVYKKSEKDIKIPILIYHAFRTPIPEEDIYKLFSCQENFEENVKTLLDAGYTFITLEDLYKYNNGEIGLPEKVIIITMDNGWSGCYTEAYPVLQKYQIHYY